MSLPNQTGRVWAYCTYLSTQSQMELFRIVSRRRRKPLLGVDSCNLSMDPRERDAPIKVG